MIPAVAAAAIRGAAAGGGGGGEHAYVTAVKDDSPFFYWRLGESAGATEAADETGNGNTGTYQNSPNFGQTGAISGDADTAVGFDSAESEYVIADSVLGDWSTFAQASARTVEFWIKTTEADANARVFATANDSSTTFFQLILNNGAAGGDGWTALRLRDESNRTYDRNWNQSEVDIYDGSWHHIVIVQNDHRDHTVYVDGSAVTTTTNGTTYATPAEWQYALPFAALNNRGTIQSFGDIQLDEVAFYNSALSQERVQAHYNAA